MTVVYSKTLATIDSSTDDSEFGPNGGFRAVLSTPSRDRDGDELAREDWLDLPDRLPLDVDHGMSVATTIGSFHPYWEDSKMMMEASFSSIERAQEVRTLVNEGHVGSVSVAFMTDKTKKSGEPRRELLNCGVVCIPSNRDAKILESKALDARAEELGAAMLADAELDAIMGVDDKSPDDDIEIKADKEPYGNVEYADPGYRDGIKRYPVNTPEHVRAAWSYIHHSHDRTFYTPEQLSHIESSIRSAAHKFGIELSDDKSVDDAEREGVRVDIIPQINVAEFERLIKEAVADAAKVLSDLTGVDTSPIVKAAADQPLAQAIHDAAVHLGAICYPLVPDIDSSGSSEGANDPSGQKAVKSADFRTLIAGVDAAIDEAYRLSCTVDRAGLPEAAGQALDLLTAAHESVGNLMKELGIFDPDADEGYNKSALDAFVGRLTEILDKSDHESPAESPADDASTKEPSEAAEDAADGAVYAEAMQMWLSLSNHNSN